MGESVKQRGVKRVSVIGIGTGDPGQLTLESAKAIGDTDVFFFLDKRSEVAELGQIRQLILDSVRPDGGYRSSRREDPPRRLGSADYGADVGAWHAQRLELFRSFFDELAEGERGAFLVWGDPALYDSVLRVLEELRSDHDFDVEIETFPGLSAPQVLAARFNMALHSVGKPILVTTGRRLTEDFSGDWPEGFGEVTVMLDGKASFTEVPPEGVEIFWGAYLGTPDEVLISGPLAEVADEIVAERARLRDLKGWMFDTYLLRKTAE